MKLWALLATLTPATLAMGTTMAQNADKSERVYEMRTYYAPEGRLDDLHARFRNHTVKLFEKHGMTNIGYWVPIDNKENKLVYILAYPSREAAKKSWAAFGGDPAWKAVKKETEAKGPIVAKVESLYLNITDYSPEPKAAATGDRIHSINKSIRVPRVLVLTAFENVMLGQNLGDFHSGMRAYSARSLRSLPFETFTDDFGFDSQLLIAAAYQGLRMGDVPVPTVYTPESSQIGWRKGIRYTVATLVGLGRYLTQRAGLARFPTLTPVLPSPAGPADQCYAPRVR